VSARVSYKAVDAEGDADVKGLPLFRIGDAFTREGVSIERAPLSRWKKAGDRLLSRSFRPCSSTRMRLRFAAARMPPACACSRSTTAPREARHVESLFAWVAAQRLLLKSQRGYVALSPLNRPARLRLTSGK
jgi:hypothetical protein